LSGIFELDQLLLQTYISHKQLQKPVEPWHVDQLCNSGQDINLGGPPWTSP
jgi:hypothetical protein